MAIGGHEVEDQFAQFAHRIGLEFKPGTSIVSHHDPSTLFITAGIQLFRRQIEEDDLEGAGCANTQWCLRMNALDSVGTTQKLTAFRLMTALAWARRDRIEQLGSLISFFSETLHVALDELRFKVSLGADGQYDDIWSFDALRRLGVRDRHITARPRKWAAPFGRKGPMGPNLFISVASGTDGAEMHFWNAEFLDFRWDGREIVRAQRPLLDCAGNVDAAAAVAARSYDVHRQGVLSDLGALSASLMQANTTEAAPRIVADHMRSLALLLDAGVLPSPRAHGAVLRRLARRAMTLLSEAGAREASFRNLLFSAHEAMGLEFPAARQAVMEVELDRFERTVANGRKEFDAIARLAEDEAELADAIHRLNTSHGVPERILRTWLSGAGLAMSEDAFRRLQSRHTEFSRGARHKLTR